MPVQVGRDPNIVEMLGVCAGTLVSPFLPKSLGQLVLTPGVERLPMSSLVSSFSVWWMMLVMLVMVVLKDRVVAEWQQ